MDPVILTHSGNYFNFLAPEESEILIDDIAWGLSHLCRFTGHCTQFYSVAQHSLYVSLLVPPEHALAGLLHDASEAFIGDVSRPLKGLLPDYRAIEKRIQAAILSRFGLAAELPSCVKEADLLLLATERRDLMPPHVGDWRCLDGISPIDEKITPFSRDAVRTAFLGRFNFLAHGGKLGHSRTHTNCTEN
jgi:5'-deoxynucleotidase YfbR-like HD superfamily hydrolase